MNNKMLSSRFLFNFIFLLICVFIVTNAVEAAYRKPPFNGSIFGKRSGNGLGKLTLPNFNKQFYNCLLIIDYDNNGKAIPALCEIALEACQSWFPQDKK